MRCVICRLAAACMDGVFQLDEFQEKLLSTYLYTEKKIDSIFKHYKLHIN